MNKKSTISFLIILAVILFYSCKSSTDPVSPNIGDLQISVLAENYSVFRGAKVTVKGIDSTKLTDDYGKVLFSNIPEGTYEVIASFGTTYSGKEYAKVESNSLNKLTISMRYGISIAPKISFLTYSPYIYTYFKTAYGDTLKLNLSITDSNTPYSNINVQISSNYDGKLFDGSPNQDGKIYFSSNSLSKNQHIIRITAKDNEGNITKDSTRIYNILPPKASLSYLTDKLPKIGLKWTTCNDESFTKYVIYRTTSYFDSYNPGSQLLTTITDKNTTYFLDEQPPISDSVVYKIVTYNSSGEYNPSNNLKVTNYFGNIYSYNISDAVFHPSLPVVYFITSDKILGAYDYDQKRITKTINLFSIPNYLTIGDCGQGIELFIPDKDGYISVYDPTTFNKKAYFYVSSAEVYSVAVDQQGFIYSYSGGTYSNIAIRSINRQNGTISSAFVSSIPYGGGRIIFNSSKKELYYYNFYNYNLNYLKIGNDGALSGNKTVYNSSGISSSIFEIAPSNEYFINSASAFIFKADDSFALLGNLPRGGQSFTDYDFANNGSTIYASSSSKYVYEFNYSTKENTRQFPILGYPIKICFKDSRILVVSKTTLDSYNSPKYIFEVIKL